MADKLILFSDADLADLRDVIAFKRSRQPMVNTSNRGPNQDVENAEQPAPELYVALAPAGGIPAIQGLVPGSASCTVYRIVPDPTGATNGSIQQVETAAKLVYNISSNVIPDNQYIVVYRDKFGQWLADVLNDVPCNDIMLVKCVELTKDVTGAYHVTIETTTYNVCTGQYGPNECITNPLCDCAGGTGTGTGGYIGVPCCASMPEQICATISASGSCSFLNGLQVTLTYVLGGEGGFLLFYSWCGTLTIALPAGCTNNGMTITHGLLVVQLICLPGGGWSVMVGIDPTSTFNCNDINLAPCLSSSTALSPRNCPPFTSTNFSTFNSFQGGCSPSLNCTCFNSSITSVSFALGACPAGTGPAGTGTAPPYSCTCSDVSQGGNLPYQLKLTIVNVSGCACMAGTYTLTDNNDGIYSFSGIICGLPCDWSFGPSGASDGTCVNSNLTSNAVGFAATTDASPASQCNPLIALFANGGAGYAVTWAGCTGTIAAIVHM